MGDTNFRATFSADTSGFASQMRQMKEDSNQMASEMIEDALEVAKATDQSVNKVLKEQIALYEKRRELLKSEERMELDSRFRSKLDLASPSQRAGINSQWNAAKADLTEQFKRDDIQIDLLREVINTLKETAQQQMVQDADASADNVRAVKEGKQFSSPDEEFKARVQADYTKTVVDKTRVVDKEKDDTMWETAKGTMLGQLAINAMRVVGSTLSGAVSSTDGEIAAAKLWEVVPMVGPALSAAQSRHIELADQRDRAAHYLRARGASVDLLSDEVPHRPPPLMTEEEIKARGRGDIKDNVKVYNAAEMKAKKDFEDLDAKKKINAEDAAFAKKVDEYEAGSSWKYLNAGVDGVDFLNRAGRLLPALGTAEGLQGQTKAMIDITQGGGIGEGAVMGLADILRQNGGGDIRSTMGHIVGELAAGGTNKASRDRHVNDVLSMTNARFGEGFATSDPIKMAKIKSAFQSNFGNTLGSADNISSIMNTMAKPSDEYQQALNYKIYADQMAREGKEASYVGFQKWQEKPEDGLLGGKMSYLKDVYGSGQYGVMAMQGAGIGRTWEANELYLKGGSNGLSAEEISAKSKRSVGFDATKFVTDRQVNQAKLTDAYTKGMVSGITEAMTQMAEALGPIGAVLNQLLSFLKSEKKN